MDLFRGKIFANMPKIQNALMKFVNFIFKAFDATIQLGTRVWSILSRVWSFFTDLDKATDGWSTKILLAIAAWELLNLSFLATPLGMILTGLLAILALWDDFEVWKEGGKSLFDWSAAVPIINGVKAALSSLADVWRKFVDVVFDLVLAFQELFKGDTQGFFDNLKDAAKDLLGVFTKLWDVLKYTQGVFDSVGNVISSKLSGIFGQGNAAPALAGIMQPSPLMPQGGDVNQRVSQETNILVQGAADAKAIGQEVAGQQNRVNFDMVRNMRGAVK
jgi:hypothetical protein